MRLQIPLILSYVPRAACVAELATKTRSFISQASGPDDIELIQVLEQKELSGYKFVRGLYHCQFLGGNEKPLEMSKCFTLDGAYVGDWRMGEFLIKSGIQAELIDKTHKVCSVGYCAREAKWYGWSHRAMCGFGLGNKLFEERYIFSDQTPFVECGKVTITSDAQARKAACNFANYVS